MEPSISTGSDRPHVLVVDDDPDVLASLADELSAGYVVTPVSSGEGALVLLGARSFDAIISDVRMPGMGGVEVIRRARAVDADIVQILLTGYSDEAARFEALAAGGAYKLSKPWGEELEIILNRALEQRQAVRRARTALLIEREIRTQIEQAVARLSSMATLGTLAAGVLHELRQPVTCLSLNLACMKHEVDSLRADANALVRAEIDSIYADCTDSARQILEIADNLRSYSAPARRSHFRPLDFSRCISRAVQMVAYECRRGVKVCVDVGEIQGRVLGHEGEIVQVLVNLMLNAIQAMDGRGRIDVHVRESDASVTVAVEDSGPGVAPGVLQRVFQPFFTTKTEEQGNGLGLWVSLEIARRHGGNLACVERSGPGAVFVLELPLDAGEPSAEDHPC